MDTEKCRAVLAAIEYGSMSAAARQLGYTPSGILRMVDSLEGELGIRLIERTPRGVRATSEGGQVLPMLRDVVNDAARVQQKASEVAGMLTGEVNIALYTSVASTWLPRVLQVFEAEYPGIRVRTREAGNEQIVQWIEERAVDCVLLARRPFHGDWIGLYVDRLVAWLPANHPRANDKAFPLAELEDAPFIEISPNQDTDVSRLLTSENVMPDVRYTTTSSYTAYRMVEAGLGLSANNELMTPTRKGGVAVLPFDPPHTIELGIAVPSLANASPATQHFIDCVKRVAQQADAEK